MTAKTTKKLKAVKSDAKAVSLSADIFNTQGKKTGSLTLPENLFGVAWNDALMHQVVTSMQDNARNPVAHVKTRGDVRGGGRKPWRQKGTGRARHGSIRSPIWRGGGVTHGPRKEKIYARAIPRKMRAKALAMALSRKLHDGEVVFVDSFAFQAPKTAVAKNALVSLSRALGFKKLLEKRANFALIALAEPREAATKSFRNIGNVAVKPVRDLNPVSVLQHSYLVIENPKEAVSILTRRLKGAAAISDKERMERKHTIDERAILLAQRGDQ